MLRALCFPAIHKIGMETQCIPLRLLDGWCASDACMDCTCLRAAELNLLPEEALSLEPLTSRAKDRSRPDIACTYEVYQATTPHS